MRFQKKVATQYDILGASDRTFLDDIYRVVQDNAFTDRWMSAYSDADLREQLDFDEGENDEEKLWERARTMIDDHLEEFVNKFRKNHRSDGDRLVVWRCLSVKDVDAALKAIEKAEPFEGTRIAGVKKGKGIGVFWSYSKEDADCHWGQQANKIVVQGEVDFSDIDLEETARANINDVNECEIHVNEGAEVLIDVVFNKDGKPSPCMPLFSPPL